MSLTAIETLLEEKIGLSVDAVGTEVIAKAVENRMRISGVTDHQHYLARLLTSPKEWDELLETVVIPETWFFRNRQSFVYLGQLIRSEWLPMSKDSVLRVLSVPCSTGEESYSIAMTLKEAGLAINRFHIDAIDLSRRALQKAAQGVYGPESFRGKGNFAFREQYFIRLENSFQMSASIKNTVCFMQGNLIDEQSFAAEEAYDVIFCRNLLIYLGESAKLQAVNRLATLLAKNGILFVGHAERPAFNDLDFRWIRQSGVFACQRSNEIHNISQRSSPKAARHSEFVEGKQKGTAILKKKNGRQSPSKKKKQYPEWHPEPVEGPVEWSKQTSLHRPQRQVKPLLPAEFERRKTERFAAEPHQEPGEQPVPFVDRRKPRDEATTLLDTARQFADQGALEEALELCDKVLRRDVAHVHAHFLKGLIHQALGDEAQAEQWLNRTVYLEPNHHEALHYLAFLAEFKGDHKKSLLLRQRMERIQKKRTED